MRTFRCILCKYTVYLGELHIAYVEIVFLIFFSNHPVALEDI